MNFIMYRYLPKSEFHVLEDFIECLEQVVVFRKGKNMVFRVVGSAFMIEAVKPGLGEISVLE